MRPVTFVLLGVRSAAVANPISLWVAGAFMLPHTDLYFRKIFVQFSSTRLAFQSTGMPMLPLGSICKYAYVLLGTTFWRC